MSTALKVDIYKKSTESSEAKIGGKARLLKNIFYTYYGYSEQRQNNSGHTVEQLGGSLVCKP